MAKLHVNLGNLTDNQHKIHTPTCQHMTVKDYVVITPINLSVRVILADAWKAVNNRGMCFVPSICDKEDRHTDKDVSLCDHCLKEENGQIRRKQ